jgi:hypothetical protein
MSKSQKLLVEGNDDVHVVSHLCKAHGILIPDAFEISDKKGIRNLLDVLRVELNDSNIERLGILVNADTDLQARWQSLRTILTQEGYSVPEQPMTEGTILHDEDRPTVGIWLMPDNRLPGMRENFVAQLVPAGDSLLPYAQQCLQHLPEQRFPSVLQAKAEIHTWLAWQEEPGKPFGVAITAHYLDPQSEQAQKFISWLRALFTI